MGMARGLADGLLRLCNGVWKDLDGDAVDIVEAVRCGKCKYWDPDSEYCQFWHGLRHPGHYCGEGVKKGD